MLYCFYVNERMVGKLDKIRLTQLTTSSGWAAKIGPKDLAKALENIPQMNHENLIVGYEKSDDAAVYKIDEHKAIIQTLDFFTPVVDDPYVFGEIAAANSLSDVYAMGGKPILAMNIVCFPNCLDMSVLGEILKGGQAKVQEAGALLVGGHSVEDNEPKYGLSVTGIVSPDKVLKNSGARPGDVLILTKPIGTGVLNTAIKGEVIEIEHYNEAIKVMSSLNKYAAEVFHDFTINAATDITGFGLVGHLVEMAKGSETTIEVFSGQVPIISGAIDYAAMGIIPAGMYNNRDYFEDDVHYANEKIKNTPLCDLLYDPQTSGGLLLSLPEKDGGKMVEALKKNGCLSYSIIGKVHDKKEKYLIME